MPILHKPVEKDWNKYFTCINCWEEKMLNDEFWRRSGREKMWFAPKCKECLKKDDLEYRQTHRDSIRESGNRYARRWRAEHKEEEKEKRLEYYRTHRQRIAENNKIRRNKNRDKIREYRKNRWDKDKETRKVWYEKNKDTVLLKNKERERKKGYLDAHFKTQNVIRRKWIRPKCCSLCWCGWLIISHHPNYEEWNRVVFCCNSCHRLIHMGLLKVQEENVVTICERIWDKRAIRCEWCWKLIPKVTSTKYCSKCWQKKRV